MLLLKLQILSNKAAQWVGWCKHRLAILSSIRKPGRILKQTYALPEGVIAQVISSDICDIIRIWGGGVTGIICHPRSQNEVDVYVIPAGLYGQPAMDVTAIKGGWATDKDGNFVELTTTYDYPLVDADNASFLLSGETDVDTGKFLDKQGDYGNIYWHNNDVDNLSIISYKGIPTRHFMLTQQDTITGADFAIFGQGVCIYKEGVLLTYSRKGQDGNPEAICGIAELDGEIICITYSGVSIYQGEEWIDIPIVGWLSSSAWFFDSTGKKAVNSAGTYILTFTKADDGTITGSQTINYIPPGGNFLYLTSTMGSGGSTAEYHADGITQETCFELTADGAISKLVMVGSLTATCEYSSDSSSSYADWSIYGGGECTVTIEGPDSNGIVCAGISGSPPGAECGPTTCSFSGASQIGSTCCAIIPNAGCYPTNETMTVSATFTGPGFSCSGSKTFTVMAKAGHWSSPGSCSASYLTGDKSVTGHTPCYHETMVEGYDPGSCTGDQTDTGPTMCETFEDWGPGGFGSYDGGYTSSQGTYTQYVKLFAGINFAGGSPPCFCEYNVGAAWANIVNKQSSSWSGYYYVQDHGPCAGKVFPWGSDWCDTYPHYPYGVPMSFTSYSGYNTRGGTVTYTWICT
jgi:hypothetical protein